MGDEERRKYLAGLWYLEEVMDKVIEVV
jgi:hypothetical protein